MRRLHRLATTVTVADSDIWTFSPSAVLPEQDNNNDIMRTLFNSPSTENKPAIEKEFIFSPDSTNFSEGGSKTVSSNPFEAFFS